MMLPRPRSHGPREQAAYLGSRRELRLGVCLCVPVDLREPETLGSLPVPLLPGSKPITPISGQRATTLGWRFPLRGPPMRILLTNDDGIDAPGLHVLAHALDRRADLVVPAATQ